GTFERGLGLAEVGSEADVGGDAVFHEAIMRARRGWGTLACEEGSTLAAVLSDSGSGYPTASAWD
ncbi:MAG: hypothetical protein ACC726_15310, partial [Chloroflexota bacterium]